MLGLIAKLSLPLHAYTCVSAKVVVNYNLPPLPRSRRSGRSGRVGPGWLHGAAATHRASRPGCERLLQLGSGGPGERPSACGRGHEDPERRGGRGRWNLS